jgi:hypothetical protein
VNDDQIVLHPVDGNLDVTGPEAALTPDAVASLRDIKDALLVVAEVFPGVSVVGVNGPTRWPPQGGFVPAWRRLRGGKPLVVLPSERVPLPTYPPPAPTSDDWRLVCPVCDGKGRCRDDHDLHLRRAGERLLRRTKSEKRRAQIEAALATLPPAPPPPPRKRRDPKRAWKAPKTTTTRQGRERVWGRGDSG